jgi:hypothetical protein
VPNLLKGTENVTTLGVILRMTITSVGLAGISFDDMPAAEDEEPLVAVENGLSEMYPVRTPTPIAAAGKRRKAVPRGPGRLRLVAYCLAGGGLNDDVAVCWVMATRGLGC